jgi:hypothetical protein
VNSVEFSRQEIRDRLTSEFVQAAIEGGVPSAYELERVDGAVKPYIVYQFQDFQVTNERGIGGVRFDTYMQPVNFYAIGPDVASSQAVAMKLNEKFLGYQPMYSSMMRKRVGAGTYVSRQSNGAEEAFITLVTFAYNVQFLEI